FYYAGAHVASGLLSIVFSLASIGNVALGSLIFGTRVERRVLAGGVFSVVGSVIAFSVYFTLLGRIGAARAGYTTVMYPVIALIVSTFAENYRWSLLAVLGLAAVLAGNLLVLRAPRK